MNAHPNDPDAVVEDEDASFKAGEDRVKAKCEGLRDEWSKNARLLRDLHGEDDPTARAFDICVSSLYKVVNDDDIIF